MIEVGEYTLDEYQERSLPALAEGFRQGLKRQLLVAPTGSGKTLVSLGIEQACIEKGTTCGFITSGRQLIFQKARAAELAGINYSVLMSNSNFEWNPDADLVIISKDTLEARVGKIPWRQPVMLCVDEADVATSPNWIGMIKASKFTIGLTATPCDGSGKGLGFLYERIVEVANYSELITSGRLVDIPEGNCFAPYSPDMTGGKSTANDWNQGWLGGRMNTPKLVGDIVSHWKQYGQDRPTICFGTTKDHTAGLAEAFNGAGISAEFVIDQTDQVDRDAIFGRVESGETKVLVNCSTLTRGFDLPMLSCCILAKPTKRLRLYLQMVGRVLRASPGKADAMLLDHSGATHEFGYPTLNRTWSLEMDVRCEDLITGTQDRHEVPKPETECRNCGAVLPTPRKCPVCGHENKRHGHQVTNAEGQLRVVARKDAKSGDIAISDPQKIWNGILWQFARARSPLRYANAAAAFKRKVGEFPEHYGLLHTVKPAERQMQITRLFPWMAKDYKSRRVDTPSLFGEEPVETSDPVWGGPGWDRVEKW